LCGNLSHVLCTEGCYGSTFRTLEHARAVYSLSTTYLDQADLDAARGALRPDTLAQGSRITWK
jgi:hypothetical protein